MSASKPAACLFGFRRIGLTRSHLWLTSPLAGFGEVLRSEQILQSFTQCMFELLRKVLNRCFNREVLTTGRSLDLHTTQWLAPGKTRLKLRPIAFYDLLQTSHEVIPGIAAGLGAPSRGGYE